MPWNLGTTWPSTSGHIPLPSPDPPTCLLPILRGCPECHTLRKGPFPLPPLPTPLPPAILHLTGPHLYLFPAF